MLEGPKELGQGALDGPMLLGAPPQFNQLIQVNAEGRSESLLQALLAKLQGDVPRSLSAPEPNLGLIQISQQVGVTQNALENTSQALQSTMAHLQNVENVAGIKNLRDENLFMEMKFNLDDIKNDVLLLQGVIQRWGGVDAELASKHNVDYLLGQLEPIWAQLNKFEAQGEKWDQSLQCQDAILARLERIELISNPDELLPILSQMENRVKTLEIWAHGTEGKCQNQEKQMAQLLATLLEYGKHVFSIKDQLSSEKRAQRHQDEAADKRAQSHKDGTPSLSCATSSPLLPANECLEQINLRFSTLENFALSLQKENAHLQGQINSLKEASVILTTALQKSNVTVAALEKSLQTVKQGGGNPINTSLKMPELANQAPPMLQTYPPGVVTNPPRVVTNPPRVVTYPPGVVTAPELSQGPPEAIILKPPAELQSTALGAAIPSLLAQGFIADALSGLQPPLPESPAPQCNVQAIDTNPPSQGGSLALLMGARAIGGDWPKLENKLQGGWEDFSRKWLAKMSLMKGICGTVPPDELLFEAVKLSLDSPDQVFLQNFRESGPTQPFSAFFAVLKQKYSTDPTVQNRKNWEGLKLTQTGGRLTMQDWSLFQEKFFLFRQRVEDRTEVEEYNFLMQRLPIHWKREVTREESRRRKYRTLVRVTGVPPQWAFYFKEVLTQQFQVEIWKAYPHGQGITVVCKGEEEAQKLLSRSGWSLNNFTIKVTKIDMTMSSDEICQFITDRVKDEERVQSFAPLHGISRKCRSPTKCVWSPSGCSGEVVSVRNTQIPHQQ